MNSVSVDTAGFPVPSQIDLTEFMGVRHRTHAQLIPLIRIMTDLHHLWTESQSMIYVAAPGDGATGNRGTVKGRNDGEHRRS